MPNNFSSMSSNQRAAKRIVVPSTVELYNVMASDLLAPPLSQNDEEGQHGSSRQPRRFVRPECSSSLLNPIRLEIVAQHDESKDIIYSKLSLPTVHPSWQHIHEQTRLPCHLAVEEAISDEKVPSASAALTLRFTADSEMGLEDPNPFLQIALDKLVRIQLDDKRLVTDLLPINAVFVQFSSNSSTSSGSHSHHHDRNSSDAASLSWYVTPSLHDSLVDQTLVKLSRSLAPAAQSPVKDDGSSLLSNIRKDTQRSLFDDTDFDALDSVPTLVAAAPQHDASELRDEPQNYDITVSVTEPNQEAAPDAAISTATDSMALELTGDGVSESDSKPAESASNLSKQLQMQYNVKNNLIRSQIQAERLMLQKEEAQLRLLLHKNSTASSSGSPPSTADRLHEAEVLNDQTLQVVKATAKLRIETSMIHLQLTAQRVRLVQELQATYPITEVVLDGVSSDTAGGPPRLRIRGLELPAWLSSPLPSSFHVSVPNAPSEDEVSAAMGFLCHVVCRLSAYLGIPLRHRLFCQSSRSVIQDALTGGFFPLFVTARQLHHPQERDKLAMAWDRMHRNVDCLTHELGLKVVGTESNRTLHILAKIQKAYKAVIHGC